MQHQLLSDDMFDYYGTEYDEEAGGRRRQNRQKNPLHDGENTFYGREVHEAIHEFVNIRLQIQRHVPVIAGAVGLEAARSACRA